MGAPIPRLQPMPEIKVEAKAFARRKTRGGLALAVLTMINRQIKGAPFCIRVVRFNNGKDWKMSKTHQYATRADALIGMDGMMNDYRINGWFEFEADNALQIIERITPTQSARRRRELSSLLAEFTEEGKGAQDAIDEAFNYNDRAPNRLKE